MGFTASVEGLTWKISPCSVTKTRLSLSWIYLMLIILSPEKISPDRSMVWLAWLFQINTKRQGECLQ